MTVNQLCLGTLQVIRTLSFSTTNTTDNKVPCFEVFEKDCVRQYGIMNIFMHLHRKIRNRFSSSGRL